MEKIITKTERCKACGLCVSHCPKKCISFGENMNGLGYYPIVIDKEVCVLCGSCYATCPDGVFEFQA